MGIGAGVRLGPYEIVAPLGAGGMGEVWRARDPRLGRDVAVKVLPARVGADPDRLRRFQQEALAAGALNHQNLMSVYDIGEHEGSPYIVFELLQGKSLRQRLLEGRPPARRAVEWAAQAARGLSAAHDKGIVHRDVKPENLFVLGDGRIKVLDFGLAKLDPRWGEGDSGSAVETRSQLTDPGVVLGTVSYMSPEQVRGAAVDSRSDVFSLGAVLYEMLTGRRPFVHETAAETMTAILKEDPPEFTTSGVQVPPVYERIVRRCLEKDPAARFRSAHDLAFALEAVGGNGESTAALALTSPRSPRRLVVTLATVAVALVLAWAILHRPRASAEPPSYQRLTFRRGFVHSARFAADGQSVVYAAAWEGAPSEVFLTQRGSGESRPLGFGAANLLALSARGELALGLEPRFLMTVLTPSVLARAPLTGGAARRLLPEINAADWAPDGSTLAAARLVPGAEGARVEFPLGTPAFESPQVVGSLRVSPQGDRLAFFSYGEPTRLMVYEGKAPPRELVTGLDLRSAGIAWAPSGREIFFGAARGLDEGSLHAVDLAGHERPLLRLPGGLRVQDVSRDGTFLLTHLRLRRQMRFGRNDGSPERDLSWFTDSQVNDISADGRQILFIEAEIGSNDNGRPVFALYLRPADGGPALKLGSGFALNGAVLSPDGSRVLAVGSGAGDRLLLVPTREGEAMVLPAGPVREYGRAEWMPDGQRLLFSGNDGEGWRTYLQDVASGPPRPVTPRGFLQARAHPDGRSFAVLGPEAGSLLTVSLDEGAAPRKVPGQHEGRRLLRVSRDGRSVLACQDNAAPNHLFRIDLATGVETLLATLMPPDPAGVWSIQPVVANADGAYVYTARQDFSDLYAVSGIK
ncbi:MAG: protein kinase [Vicinamibacteria bacterium]